jgi:hypothetical protein
MPVFLPFFFFIDAKVTRANRLVKIFLRDPPAEDGKFSNRPAPAQQNEERRRFKKPAPSSNQSWKSGLRN